MGLLPFSSPHALRLICLVRLQSLHTYMALVPIIQPPIMKALTTKEEREIKMGQLRPVSKAREDYFPACCAVYDYLVFTGATPLVGMFCFGNLMKECGVVDRLSKTAQNELINTVTIFLGLAVDQSYLRKHSLRSRL